MDLQHVILISIGLPVLGSLCIAQLGKWPNVRDSALVITAAVLCGTISILVPTVIAGNQPEINVVPWALSGDAESGLVARIPLGFKVEPLGMLFAIVASVLWLITSIYAIGYMRGHHEKNQTRFFVFFSLAITGALGVAFARNVFTLFVFYEFLTLSTYPLVTHHGDEKARRAGRTYLGILIGTSVLLLLLGIVWTWQLAGTLEFTQGGILHSANELENKPWLVGVLLALYCFGTGKAALMPFHRWLPGAMVAPTPVSALLHAVAVVKAGVFTVLKVIVYIFGTEFLRETDASVWLMYVAGATLITASLIAMSKDNLKERLAYSTISQLSYIVLGASLANSAGVLGGGMHIAMHAVGKITLFFCAGAIMVASHKTKVSQLNGLGKVMPVTMAAFTVGAFSVIGVPPMGGAWSKWFLALGTLKAGQEPLLAALMISSLLNIAYLMPIPVRAFFLKEESPKIDADNDSGGISSVNEAPLLCVVPLCVTASGCLILFFLADAVHQFLEPIGR